MLCARACSAPDDPYLTQSGADREGDGDQYIAHFGDGCWCGFKYFKFDLESKITLRYRGNGNGSLIVATVPKKHVKDALADGADEMRRNALNPQICQAKLEILPTENWAEVTADFFPMPEEQALYFAFQGVGTIDIRDFTME